MKYYNYIKFMLQLCYKSKPATGDGTFGSKSAIGDGAFWQILINRYILLTSLFMCFIILLQFVEGGEMMTQEQRDEMLLSMNGSLLSINTTMQTMQKNMFDMQADINGMKVEMHDMKADMNDMKADIHDLQEAGKRRDKAIANLSKELKEVKEICKTNSNDICEIKRNIEDLQPFIDKTIERIDKLELKTKSLQIVS